MVPFYNHHLHESEEKALHLLLPLHALIISVTCLHNSATCTSCRVVSYNYGGTWTDISFIVRYYAYFP